MQGACTGKTRYGEAHLVYKGPEPELALFTGATTMVFAVKGYIKGGIPGAFLGAVAGAVTGVALWALFKATMELIDAIAQALISE